ncbi:hypothetical protein PsYK624_014870 [Phanerochaete sordida]|uniref:Uncharacterized protein n=1 Tax=Phanerochaete sordida TaxID=48140 RepID=A0A9P3L8W2_9APHY|nr:hypothetical protein PsYK624_014870 [Phanerochaete sordida]
MFLARYFSLLLILAGVCRGVDEEREEVVDTTDLSMCMNKLLQADDDMFDWVSTNPSLLVSLALNLNRTGSCGFDDLLSGATGDASGSPLRVQDGTRTIQRRQDESNAPTDLRPTPAPTGPASLDTTVHITDEHNFALLLPSRQGELVSDAESDGVSFCTPTSGDSSCTGQRMQGGFIVAAALQHADDGSWVQVTGCIDPSKSLLDPSDAGGQMDVRFPNGAQCTFGGYGASFIELVEPALGRFCLRCCASENDQVNCNSHRDREGCPNAIPGTYDFPEVGVSCS